MDNLFASKQASKQASISIFSTICALIIVLRHSTNFYKINSYNATMNVSKDIFGRVCYIAQGIVYGGLSNIALYGFFVLSGFLFFRTFSLNKTIEKYKSRIKSLLIPYLLWQTIDYWFMALLTNIPFISARINTAPYSLNPIDYIKSIVFPESIFWYLNYLILFVLISPILFLIIKRKEGAIFLSIALLIGMGFVGEQKMLFSLSCYIIGGIAAIYFNEDLLRKNDSQKVKWLHASSVILISALLYVDVTRGVFHVPTRFIINLAGIYFFWMFISSITEAITQKGISRHMNNSFYIYCAHGVIVTICKKAIYSFTGENGLLLLLGWACCFLLTLTIVFASYGIMKKWLPGFLRVLCGGR